MIPVDFCRRFQPVEEVALRSNNTINQFISDLATAVGVTEFNADNHPAIYADKLKPIVKVSVGMGKRPLFKLKGVKNPVSAEELTFNHVALAKEITTSAFADITNSKPSIVE